MKYRIKFNPIYNDIEVSFFGKEIYIATFYFSLNEKNKEISSKHFTELFYFPNHIDLSENEKLFDQIIHDIKKYRKLFVFG